MTLINFHFSSAPVIKTDKGNSLRSVDFSPMDPTHLAVAGCDGGKIIDIRQPNQLGQINNLIIQTTYGTQFI